MELKSLLDFETFYAGECPLTTDTETGTRNRLENAVRPILLSFQASLSCARFLQMMQTQNSVTLLGAHFIRIHVPHKLGQAMHMKLKTLVQVRQHFLPASCLCGT
mmetsp:Transcript_88060/g.234144  ORF Transcript_88060/g.234144 Transcript_88060/m.234144 type:complete len:105 (+) Transcript_88060:202-516(+)